MIAALKCYFGHPKQHVLLEEVRAGTGYGDGVERTADALVCSVWPSRGIYLMGIEVKVSRSDWFSELRDVKKSVSVQKHCERWWIAAPPGIVQREELPATWGLLEVVPRKISKKHPKKHPEPYTCKVVAQAPKLEAVPLSLEFIASVMRNMAKAQDMIRTRTFHEMQEQCNGYRVQKLEQELLLAQTQCAEYKEKYSTARKTRDEFDEWKMALTGHCYGATLDEAKRRMSILDVLMSREMSRTTERLAEALEVLKELQAIANTDEKEDDDDG